MDKIFETISKGEITQVNIPLNPSPGQLIFIFDTDCGNEKYEVITVVSGDVDFHAIEDAMKSYDEEIGIDGEYSEAVEKVLNRFDLEWSFPSEINGVKSTYFIYV